MTEVIRLSLALVISITGMILINRYLNLHAFFSLLVAAVTFGLIAGKSVLDILIAMQSGFGSLLAQIGFLVAIGSCLGIVMEKTGSMEVISHRLIHLFGAKRSVLAMTVIGVIVGIPVFCDSGFIILSRLIPSIASQTALNPSQLSLALSTGLYTTHTLVPPTPGPLAAAANLGVSGSLGTIILIGIAGTIPVALVSYFLSKRLGASLIASLPSSQNRLTFKSISSVKAFLPLVLPIVLIASGSFPKMFAETALLSKIIQAISQPVIALTIGLLLAFTLIEKNQNKEWPPWISEALKDAGIILLITGAGGSFGAVIKSSGVDVILKEYVSTSQVSGIVFLLVGFIIASILKTAQGSTTSSMIITSSLLAPLAASAGFTNPVDLAILILAIGGGGMTVSHANDSYFWVVSQFGGITSKDAFRSFTLITFAQGITALLTSILLFFVL
jgi:gluconate:H+ symporter, GntP family